MPLELQRSKTTCAMNTSNKKLTIVMLAEALCLLASITGIVYFIIVSGAINPGADEPIPPLERWAAKTSLRAYLKKTLKHEENPVVVNSSTLKEGVDVYVKNCAACHGFADGKKTIIGSGMYKQPNIFSGEDWSKEKDELVYWFIEHGVRLTGMPSYKQSLTAQDKWKLVNLIKHMEKLPPDAAEYWQSKHSS
jgi:mono/diheme cytochrome c family protein